MFPALTLEETTVTRFPDIWTIIVAHPEVETVAEVRELLFSKVVERVQRLKAVHALARVRLAADLMVSQKADLEYLLQKGFEPFEQVYVMSRATAESIPTVSVPVEITFRPTKLAAPGEPAAYLDVFHTCFPETPKTIAEVQFFIQSPLWAEGQMIGAYAASNELVGSILVYWDAKRGCGVVDDVMVLPLWRGQNIARRLVGDGIRYFAARGIPKVQLEVSASNVAAVSVYRSMGYRVVNQESLLGKLV
jgi:ribosomal protein S18 acetylase RimI-like enzyme